MESTPPDFERKPEMKIVMNGRTGAVRSSFQLAWKMTLLIAVAFTIRAADAAPGKGGGGGRPGGGGGRAVGGGSRKEKIRMKFASPICPPRYAPGNSR